MPSFPRLRLMLSLGATIRDLTICESLGRTSRFEFYAAQTADGPRTVAYVVGAVLDDDALKSRVAEWAESEQHLAHGFPEAVYRTSERTLLVSRFVAGVSWREAVSAVTPESSLPWFERLVDAVAAIHRLRSFHGDLAPGAVRVCEDMTVTLLMPGVSDLVEACGGYGGWSEPELSCGALPSASSDVFSLAVAATELGGASCSLESRRQRRALARGRRPSPRFVPAHSAWPSAVVMAVSSALSSRTTRPSNAIVLRVVLRTQVPRPVQAEASQLHIVPPAHPVSAPNSKPWGLRRLLTRWVSLRRTFAAGGFVVLFVLVGHWALSRPYSPRCSDNLDCAAGLTCGSGMCDALGMVYLPPARFKGGALDGAVSDRNEPFDARLTYGFYIGESEVTQGEFAQRTGASPSYFHECGDECPVESVNWFEAVEYANLRSDEEGLPRCYQASGCTGDFGSGCPDLEPGSPVHNCVGEYSCARVEFAGIECRGYRLPTEVEWEYAARGGTREMTYAGTLEFSGEGAEASLERLARIARTAENSQVTYSAWPCSEIEGMNRNDQCGPGVARALGPNAFGLYDMLGNVGEWMTDRAVEHIGRRSGWRCFGRGEVQSNGEKSCTANVVVDRVVHEDDSSPRALRGGAFFHSASGSRVSVRNGLRWDRRFVDVGFRLVRTAHGPAE